MTDDELLSTRREQRLRTLALADQIGDDRWHEPVLPGNRSIHDQLVHLLAWDEWAIGVFEISALRPLPPVLVSALLDSDEYNARTERRHQHISRDDILSALQGSGDRALISAERSCPEGQPWLDRRIPDLAAIRITEDGMVTAAPAPPAGAAPDGDPGAGGPQVRTILRHLLEHECAHAAEISAAFGIQPNIERFMGQSGTSEE
jgi:uncharacterized damage-inducible protein DinB